MKKDPYIMFLGKKYLKDIFKIELFKSGFPGFPYELRLSYICDVYRNEPNPYFSIRNWFATEKIAKEKAQHILRSFKKITYGEWLNNITHHLITNPMSKEQLERIGWLNDKKKIIITPPW